ncbi:IS21-like element helper ATPase IstB [Geothrix sp. 21YS21S-2]|uniref:IS21-like element helper ATPase IstB n=1 Tax=Geothrix sp. 21YS21S-2 TaxID=3068893 RepID=UPI0027B8E6CE|nr:IS21-like element helper ATPase IstB [Geothrix sp. 21YS21S-2]
MSKEARRQLGDMLRELNLTGVAATYGEAGKRAEKEGWAFDRFLHHLMELELEQRRQKRLERVLKAAKLPVGKTLATLKQDLLPVKVRRQMATLIEGGFVDRGENLLAFGLPGRGKTHLVCALGAELIQRGYKVYFTPAYALVQRLLIAKQGLGLEREMRRLDAFDAIIIDDIGYIQQTRDETEVLFTLLAERYERRTVIITSNLVFSQWDRIFKDPMTTAAAIDRIIHHCVILELNGTSYRADAAKARMPQPEESASA